MRLLMEKKKDGRKDIPKTRKPRSKQTYKRTWPGKFGKADPELKKKYEED